MNILITGACGYVGSSLTPYLLSQGHNIRAVDTEWFGNNLDPHPNLEFTKKDIRDLDETFFQNIESVILIIPRWTPPPSFLRTVITLFFS